MTADDRLPEPPDPVDPVDGPGPPRAGVYDRGLQHERTSLAWDRTALSLMLVGALAARTALDGAHPLWLVPGLLAAAIGAVLLWVAARHHRRREHDLWAGTLTMRPGVMVWLTGLAAIGVSLTALVLVVLGFLD